MKSKILIVAILSLIANTLSAQARLTIENNSMRSMTVKVMQGSSGKGTLHETVTIGAYGSETVYFSNSGYYFTKTKAVLQGKDPVYRKVMTLTFSIKESSVPQATGGKQISKSEFDQN